MCVYFFTVRMSSNLYFFFELLLHNCAINNSTSMYSLLSPYFLYTVVVYPLLLLFRDTLDVYNYMR